MRSVTGESVSEPLEKDVQKRPAFSDLPLRPGDPPASAWGLYGDEDELGTLNLLTADVIHWAASNEIRTGRTVTLNLPLNCPTFPMNPSRIPCEHRFLATAHPIRANDDELTLNTQASSQWDGLRHFPYQDPSLGERRFYNGASQSDFVVDHSVKSRLGIQNVARRGIAGRGVLLDWRSYVLKKAIDYSPFEAHAIPHQQLLEVAEEQGVEWRPGDVLLIRSGWTEEYLKLDLGSRKALAERGNQLKRFVGVEASREMLEWHWNRQFAAVAGDTNAYEVWPPTKPWGVSCHEVFLSGWGMPIGELWDLEGLAKTCRELGRWSFFLTSIPLNVEGGVASPANAMAIF